MQDCGNQYVYISRLGEGSYGSVLLCRELLPGDDSETGHGTPDLVAVKSFKWAHNDSLGLRLALRELRLLKGLDHPLIIKLRRAFFSRNCRLYAIFPYIDGGCAQRALKTRYPHGLPPALLKSFAWQLCIAVRYLHQRKVLHRDIKPANVLLSSDGTIRLCDFGFARQLARMRAVQPAEENEQLTPYVQTRPYRAPEVLLGQPYGTAADIWALGATIAEMATGEVLLPGTSSLDQLWRILAAIPGPRPPPLARAVDSLRRLDPRALGTAVPPELLQPPPQPPGRPLLERLAAAPGGDGGGLERGALEFLVACLSLDPSARPSADELLGMAWLAPDGDVARLVAGNPVLESLCAEVTATATAEAEAAAAEAEAAGEEAAAAGEEAGPRAAAVPDGGGVCRPVPPDGCDGREVMCSETGKLSYGPLLRDRQSAAPAAGLLATLGSRGLTPPTARPAAAAAVGAAPAHRRSLSAGTAETQSPAEPPAGLSAAMAAAAAAQQRLAIPGGRLGSLWALEQSQLRSATTPLAALQLPQSPPPPPPPPPPARYPGALYAPPPWVTAGTVPVAVPPRRPEPVPCWFAPAAPQLQLQRREGPLPARPAASLDAAAARSWGPGGAAAADPRLGPSRSLPQPGAALLLRPKYRPGRVRQLPPPPPPALAALAAAAPGRVSRNASAPDLTRTGQDEPVQAPVAGAAPAVEAVTCRGAWSQSGCRTGTGGTESSPPRRRPASLLAAETAVQLPDANLRANPAAAAAEEAAAAAAALRDLYGDGSDDADDDDLLPHSPFPRTRGLDLGPFAQSAAPGAGAETDEEADADVLAADRFPGLALPTLTAAAAAAAAAAPRRWRHTCLGYVSDAAGGNALGSSATLPFMMEATAPPPQPPPPPQHDAAGSRTDADSGAVAAALLMGASVKDCSPLLPRVPSASEAGLGAVSGNNACGSWPPPVQSGGDGGSGRGAGVVSVYGMATGDDAPLHGRSYGTRKSTMYDSEDGWMEELGSWQDCTSKVAAGMAAAAGQAGGTIIVAVAAQRTLQLSSPTLTTFGAVDGVTPRDVSHSRVGGLAPLACALKRAVRRLRCFGGGSDGSPKAAYDE